MLKTLHEKEATPPTTNYDNVLEKYCGLQRVSQSNQDDISRFQRGDLDGVFHTHGSYHDAHERISYLNSKNHLSLLSSLMEFPDSPAPNVL